MELLNGIFGNLQEIMSSWTSIATLVGILILYCLFIKFKKIVFTTTLLTHIALAVSMSIILSFIKLFQLPYGGSANLAAMLPIILISLIYGPVIGIFCGFVYSLLNFVIGPAYILHPIQVLFDYTLPFMAIGLSGFFKNNKYLSIGVGFLGMFIFNYIAGVIFWGSYAADYGMTPLLYSLVYNGSYNLLNCIICMAISSVININRLTAHLAPKASKHLNS